MIFIIQTTFFLQQKNLFYFIYISKSIIINCCYPKNYEKAFLDFLKDKNVYIFINHIQNKVLIIKEISHL